MMNPRLVITEEVLSCEGVTYVLWDRQRDVAELVLSALDAADGSRQELVDMLRRGPEVS